MILKILLVILVILGSYLMFFKKKKVVSKNNGSERDTKKKNINGDDMIECKSCGVYSLLSDSILSSGHYYCSSSCIDNKK